MPETRTQPRPATAGNLLLVVVGIGMAFLLFLALLGLKTNQGPLYSESNMLYVALVFYAGAGTLYMGFGVSGIERYVKLASVATSVGLLANTIAVAHRWFIAGRPPFSNIYEMLLSFVWTVALLTLIAEKRYGVRIIGSVTMPLAVVSVILMQLMPSEVRPLVPALQSTWLHVHVTLAMLAYAACAVSFALAMMFLVQDDVQTETFQLMTSLGMAGIYAALLIRFSGGGFKVIAYDVARKAEIMNDQGHRVFVTIPDLGWLVVLALVSALVPTVLYLIARQSKREALFQVANNAMFISLLLQVATVAAFVARARDGVYAAVNAEGMAPTALPASPFILAGMIGSIFAGLLYMLLLWRRNDLRRMLPESQVLDRVTYKTIAIAFPLLTLMIATGAYWANKAWGSYWSWDPKEVWALITWIVYGIYLHARITHGMRGRWAAYFAIAGFAVVIFTFFGVTYLLPGLHAYSSVE